LCKKELEHSTFEPAEVEVVLETPIVPEPVEHSKSFWNSFEAQSSFTQTQDDIFCTWQMFKISVCLRSVVVLHFNDLSQCC
jgi:hypothetical protein